MVLQTPQCGKNQHLESITQTEAVFEGSMPEDRAARAAADSRREKRIHGPWRPRTMNEHGSFKHPHVAYPESPHAANVNTQKPYVAFDGL